MGKKKRGAGPELPDEPSRLDCLFSNRTFAIGIGVAIVAAFAGLAVLVVSLLGGDDIGQSASALKPTPLGAPPVYERSAIADVFGTKTWDEMTEAERANVKDEVLRVFDNSTFRASNEAIIAFDVLREGGDTLFSRQYIRIETPGGDPALAEQMYFHCEDTAGERETHRIVVSAVQSDSTSDIDEGDVQPAWDVIMAGADWASATDLGFKESIVTGRRLHGLEFAFAIDPAQAAAGRRTQYWFDVETAQLNERGSVYPDDVRSTEANWYYLRYDQIPPVIIPQTLEQPPCVQPILAKIGQ